MILNDNFKFTRIYGGIKMAFLLGRIIYCNETSYKIRTTQKYISEKENSLSFDNLIAGSQEPQYLIRVAFV